MRGLLIDKRFGHILKMNRYKFVTKGYHGLRELAKDELRALYHSKKIRPATPRYHWIDTLYALSEAALYAALVEAIEQRGLHIDYAQAFTDIRESIDEAHRDGTILDAVAGDFPRFVQNDRDLAPTLHKLRSAGKKLFLLTNSRWSYTEKMMTYLLGGAMTEYPHWRNYFDVVIVAATKPAFFQERRPLMERDGDRLEPARCRSSAARSTRAATCTISSARSARPATRSSTSATTSTATSSGARRRARGARR